jgi:hypothetical protein
MNDDDDDHEEGLAGVCISTVVQTRKDSQEIRSSTNEIRRFGKWNDTSRIL